jgi:hypothetical protein
VNLSALFKICDLAIARPGFQCDQILRFQRQTTPEFQNRATPGFAIAKSFFEQPGCSENFVIL